MLPTHGGDKRNNGIRGIPVINKQVALTLASVLFSIFLIWFSYWHAKNYGNYFDLTCDVSMCKLTAPRQGVIHDFERSNFLKVEVVRVNQQGTAVPNFADLSKNEQKKLGYTLQIEYLDSGVAGTKAIKSPRKVLLAPVDMGRKSSRSAESQMNKYKGGKLDKVYASAGSSLTLFSVLSFLGGFCGFGLVALFGQWSEQNPRKMRKSK